MHSTRIVALVAVLAMGGSSMAHRTEALPLRDASAIGIAAQDIDPRQDVAYVCRRVWRCGPSGCGWRRSCYWTPGAFAYAYPYASRPYWGWGGRLRYWKRPYRRGRTWRGRRYWR